MDIPLSPELIPVHTSVRTCTTVNRDPAGEQWLSVVTSRLVIGWRNGEIAIAFELHRVNSRVQVRRDAAAPRAARLGRKR